MNTSIVFTDGVKGLADELGIPQQTLAALRRKFERFRKYDFLSEDPVDDSIARILQYIEAGKSMLSWNSGATATICGPICWSPTS